MTGGLMGGYPLGHFIDTSVPPQPGLIRCTCEADYMCPLHGTGYDFAHQLQRYTENTARYLAGEDVVPGDCWRTVLASLLEVARDDVPHFIHEFDGGVGAPSDEVEDHPDGPRWWRESVAWVERQRPGWTLRYYYPATSRGWAYFDQARKDGAGLDRVIVTGKSPRGDWNHSALYDVRTMELEHDPFPGGAGVHDPLTDLVGLVREDRL